MAWDITIPSYISKIHKNIRPHRDLDVKLSLWWHYLQEAKTENNVHQLVNV